MYHGQTVPGFPAHPHCGFETITIVTQGYCDHADSLGAAARFGTGDVQWITTGEGLQHSEMFPLLNAEGPNTLELFQIWLNLPARSKRVPPYFSMLWKEEIPILQQKGCRIKLVAGSLGNSHAPQPPPDSWAADPENAVAIGLIDLDANGVCELPPIPAGTHRRVYLFEGNPVQVTDTKLMPGNGAVLDAAEATIRATNGAARLLWLQGRPIAEPVAKYGPFVMNTQEEIQAAMDRFRQTRFGGWPWRHQDPVHEADLRRFARFPDGSEVFRS